MTANDKNVLLDGLTKLAEDAVSLAAFLKAITTDNGEPDAAADPPRPSENPYFSMDLRRPDIKNWFLRPTFSKSAFEP